MTHDKIGRRAALKSVAGIAASVALLPRAVGAQLIYPRYDYVVVPVQIAVTDLFSDSAEIRAIGQNITRVVAADLERSGVFWPLHRSFFPHWPEEMQGRPRFRDWREVTARNLVTGRAALEADGRLRVEFQLWDVFAERQVAGVCYTSAPDEWQQVAHLIAGEIYKSFVDEDGYVGRRWAQ